MIKLIVGLGNVGTSYEFNRHNVGFWLVDALAGIYNGVWKKDIKFFGQTCKINIDGNSIILLKPATFMNKSGQSVVSIKSYFNIFPNEIIIAHDELDIPLDKIKFKKGGGHGGHNGLRDIISHIGKDFYRLRIGIDRPANNQIADFVLSNPSKKEMEVILNNINNFLQLVTDFVKGDFDKATQKLHIL